MEKVAGKLAYIDLVNLKRVNNKLKFSQFTWAYSINNKYDSKATTNA